MSENKFNKKKYKQLGKRKYVNSQMVDLGRLCDV